MAPAPIRHRRARYRNFSRDLVRETQLSVKDLIYPVFVQEEEGQTPLASLPGISRWGGAALLTHLKEAVARGIPAVALFPEVPEHNKTPDCAEAANPNNLICRSVAAIKDALPELGLICDIALDPYNPTGQDGFLDPDGTVDNDATVAALLKQGRVLAQAGADVLAPSDMMDGRVAALRALLEGEGFAKTLILAYAAKYASALYGPFRTAIGAQGALQGDKKSYQMDPANRREAGREIETDLAEGADWILVKPGHTYLDIIADCKARFGVPTFGYHVSGEYAMWAFAAKAGAIDPRAALMEILLSFRRAGCDGVLTYAAFEAATWI